MKSSVKAYVTALINTHKNEIIPNASCLINGYTHKSIKELNDLLDYISKIPEILITDTYVEINRLRDELARVVIESDTETLRRRNLQKRVVELEESCENMNEVEKNLHKKIKTLETNAGWISHQLLESDKKIRELEEVNTGVWKENRQLKLLNKHNLRKIRTLRSKLRNKLKGDR